MLLTVKLTNGVVGNTKQPCRERTLAAIFKLWQAFHHFEEYIGGRVFSIQRPPDTVGHISIDARLVATVQFAKSRWTAPSPVE